ncbi:MAG: hypothetical protein NC548_33975 [Lachnospiraceae bacterium]|nr:hypothetical protein [Lachnospiraceae bacterium]
MAGVTQAEGFSQIDRVIANSWNKIFTCSVPLFDESYRQVLFSKIIKHFYMAEIGYETVGLWQFHVNRKMEEIIPFYNKIYTATQKEFDIFSDTDYSDSGNTTGNKNETVNDNGSRNNTRTDNLETKRTDDLTDTTINDLTQVQTYDTTVDNSGSSSNAHADNYQDTPQGSLSGVEQLNYLTNARRINDSGTSSNVEKNTGDITTDNTGTQDVDHTGTQTLNYTGTQNNVETSNNTRDGNYNSTENYVRTIVGKRGNMTYPDMIDNYIEKLKNVDMMVVEEFTGEFMLIW